MNWDDLKVFLAVARSGTISGGAKQLGVQHSTVSRRVRHLEENLGTRLLDRKTGRYELTRAGKNLFDTALDIEARVLQVDGSLPGKDSKLVGSLRISAINNMASSVLMPMFASFSKRFPMIDLQVMVSNDNVSLSQREADVVIRLTNTPTETLIGKQLVTVVSTVYGAHSYLKRVREQRKEVEWIGVNCCKFHSSWTKQQCGGQPRRFTSDDTLLTRAAIREGLGVSYLPCFMGDTDPLLERYCEPNPGHNLGLWLLFHQDLKHCARVLAFREHMIQSINDKKALFEGVFDG